MLAKRLRPIVERRVAGVSHAAVRFVADTAEIRIDRDRIARDSAEDPENPYIIWHSELCDTYRFEGDDILEDFLDLARVEDPQWG